MLLEGETANTLSYGSRSPGLNLHPLVCISHTALCPTEGTLVPEVPLLVIACTTGACKVKLKCTNVQALRLCTGRTAHRGSRGIALSFPDHGTRSG